MSKRVKSILYLLLLIFSSSLTSCYSNSKNDNDNSEVIESKEDNIEGIDAKNSHYLSSLQYDISNNLLYLLDYESNNTIKEIKLDNGEFSKAVLDFDNGYAVIVLKGDKELEVKKSSVGMTIIEPETILKVSLKIYDKQLNYIKEYDITEVYKDTNEEPIMENFISYDGNILGYNTLGSINLIDLDTRKKSAIFNNSDSSIEKVKFAKSDEKLVFFGSKSSDPEESVWCGIMNLSGEVEKSFTVENYNGRDIWINGNYAILTDSVDPRIDKSSGEIPVINLTTNEMKIVKVDNSESTMAYVSSDGKYIVTASEVSEGKYRFRQYSTDKNKVIKEEFSTIEFEECKVEKIIETNNKGEFYILFIYGDGKYVGKTFKGEDI